MKHKARESVVNLLKKGDIKNLLKRAGDLHGHFCAGLAFGVKAGYLGLKRLDFENTGMEELLAIVECDNCFTDGIQVVTGCTFGNNGLIYKDIGKTAVTLVSRKLDKAFRILLKRWEGRELTDKEKEARNLFDRVVKKREQDAEAIKRMRKLWTELSFDILDKPDGDLFIVREVAVELPPYAPIYENATCEKCGETFMKPRAVLVDGKTYCLSCAGADYFVVSGKGIHSSVKEWE